MYILILQKWQNIGASSVNMLVQKSQMLRTLIIFRHAMQVAGNNEIIVL